MTTWIERAARQRSVWQVGLFLLVTAIVLTMFALNASYWRGFVLGPTVVDAAGLQAAATAVDNYATVPTPFAAVTGTKVEDTGAQEVTTYHGIISRVSAGYYALLVGDKILIVKSPDAPATTVSGSLEPMPQEIRELLFANITDPSETAHVYPLLLDTKYREPGAMSIFWALLVEGIFGFFAWRSLMRLIGRQDHPAVARAKSWGDLGVTSATLETELQNLVKSRSKGWTLTENYLVQQTMFRFNLFRMEDLVWMYKGVTKRNIHFIPAGTAYSAVLNFSDGSTTVEGKQQHVDELLQLVHNRVPWAVFGYSDDVAAFYKQSRDEFAQEVLAQKKAAGR